MIVIITGSRTRWTGTTGWKLRPLLDYIVWACFLVLSIDDNVFPYLQMWLNVRWDVSLAEVLLCQCRSLLHCYFRSGGEIFKYEQEIDERCGDFHNEDQFFKPRQTCGHFWVFMCVQGKHLFAMPTLPTERLRSCLFCPFQDSWSICLCRSHYHLRVCVIYNHNRTTAWPLDELQYNTNLD